MSPYLTLIRKLFRVPVRVWESLEERRKRDSVVAESGVTLGSSCKIDNLRGIPSLISVGFGTHLLGQLLVFAHGGKIKIGRSCFIGENSRIWSAEEIVIGDRVLISHDVNIHDNDAHSLSANLRHLHVTELLSVGHPRVLEDVKSARIVIEDDAWIGYGASILKGVHVGQGAVIGARSVVSKDVPAYAVVAGNPARIIGQSRP